MELLTASASEHPSLEPSRPSVQQEGKVASFRNAAFKITKISQVNRFFCLVFQLFAPDANAMLPPRSVLGCLPLLPVPDIFPVFETPRVNLLCCKVPLFEPKKCHHADGHELFNTVKDIKNLVVGRTA
eukprot:600457-Prorocentrum_minimum.AAC.1